MGILGTLLKNKHAGETGLAWNLAKLAGPETLGLHSSEFDHEGAMARAHAAKRVGGEDRSPTLSWTGAPAATARLLLVVEDVDAPVRLPFVHCVALLEPSLTELPAGALNGKAPAEGVHVLRPQLGSRRYMGPGPIKGHGPHRYVFQLFALGSSVDGASLEKAKPRVALATITGPVLARGRLDGFYER